MGFATHFSEKRGKAFYEKRSVFRELIFE